jgi:hypothetical protein
MLSRGGLLPYSKWRNSGKKKGISFYGSSTIGTSSEKLGISAAVQCTAGA